MKVYGFTFIKNAILYDYPVVESIKSMLPLCEKVVVAVGNSDDDTLKLVRGIDPKVEIIETIWDDNRRTGGEVLAQETMKAYQAIPKDVDWCIYLQGDEVLHQKDYPYILSAMKSQLNDSRVEGLLFKYNHFYGSYDYLATSTRWYKHEIRVIRRNEHIFSYKDAMGFRVAPNRKLRVKKVDATIYHYGWVKPPYKQQEKQKSFHKLWTADEDMHQKVDLDQQVYDYDKIDRLERFEGTHPSCMEDRIANADWTFEFDLMTDNRSVKEKIRSWVADKTGWRPGEYKNYKLLK